jgi:putative spermidine/putrescine transport system ATP-binding protein
LAGASLDIAELTRYFGQVKAVDSLSLSIQAGEFLTLLGPSGCGKTTTLMMIAGFVIPHAGSIHVDHRDVTLVPPNKRDVGMVFQNYALFPHMTIRQNIAFPLKMRKTPKDVIGREVGEALELVRLSGLGDRFPSQMSGGQQQRVALARALVFKPRILLMDEPLGALDKKLREHMQLELKHLQKTLNMTVVYVTHDQGEALTMSDRIAVMDKGRIEQLDSPKPLYENPVNRFVADFLGESNFLEGEVVQTGKLYFTVVSRDGSMFKVSPRQDVKIGHQVCLAIRPERVQIDDLSGKFANSVDAVIEEIVYSGEVTKYMVRIGGEQQISLKQANRATQRVLNVGEKVKLGWDTEDVRIV